MKEGFRHFRLLCKKGLMLPPRILLVMLSDGKGDLLPRQSVYIPQGQNLPHHAVLHRVNEPAKAVVFGGGPADTRGNHRPACLDLFPHKHQLFAV